MPDKDQESSVATDVIRELNDLVTKARAGDQSVLPQLHQALDQNPQLWQHFGGLADHVANEWITLLAGSDLAVRESLSRKAKALRLELAGEDASAIDRLLVDSVVTTWLETQYFSIVLAASGNQGQGTLRQIESVELRRDAAQKRHLAAIKSLAEVRKLLRRLPPRSPAIRPDRKGSKPSRPRAAPAATDRNTPSARTIPIRRQRKG